MKLGAGVVAGGGCTSWVKEVKITNFWLYHKLSPGDIMHIMVTIVNIIVLYTWKLVRE